MVWNAAWLAKYSPPTVGPALTAYKQAFEIIVGDGNKLSNSVSESIHVDKSLLWSLFNVFLTQSKAYTYSSLAKGLSRPIFTNQSQS